MRFRISFTAGRPEDDYWWHFKWDIKCATDYQQGYRARRPAHAPP